MFVCRTLMKPTYIISRRSLYCKRLSIYYIIWCITLPFTPYKVLKFWSFCSISFHEYYLKFWRVYFNLPLLNWWNSNQLFSLDFILHLIFSSSSLEQISFLKDRCLSGPLYELFCKFLDEPDPLEPNYRLCAPIIYLPSPER